MARWLQHAPEDSHPAERSFTPERLENLLVFHGRALPSNAVDVAGLTAEWIDGAKRQLAAGGTPSFGTTLRHSLGFAGEAPDSAGAAPRGSRTVLLGASNPELDRSLTAAGFQPTAIAFKPFDAAAAAKVNHFDTYNRTAASQRVADIVAAVRAHPGATVIADGDAALAAILAAAMVPIHLAILDVGRLSSSDQAFVEHLYSGLRRRRSADRRGVGHGEMVSNAGTSFNVASLNPRAANCRRRDVCSCASLNRLRPVTPQKNTGHRNTVSRKHRRTQLQKNTEEHRKTAVPSMLNASLSQWRDRGRGVVAWSARRPERASSRRPPCRSAARAAGSARRDRLPTSVSRCLRRSWRHRRSDCDGGLGCRSVRAAAILDRHVLATVHINPEPRQG
jgi:hypothetical protein